jgi:hypothetical protein
MRLVPRMLRTGSYGRKTSSTDRLRDSRMIDDREQGRLCYVSPRTRVRGRCT